MPDTAGSSGVSALPLEGSVGQGGDNNEADVRLVKARLVELGFDWLDGNGTIDTAMIQTIQLFQSIKNGHQKVGGDGRVDVGGSTHRWLEAGNAPRWWHMPVGSPAEGFHNTEVVDQPLDHHDYGTNWMAAVITQAAARYRDDYLASHAGAALMTVNDVSLPQGGDTLDHAGHETGLACDLRLPRSDGTAPPGTTVDHAEYDRAAMRAMLSAIRAEPLVRRVFLNDAVLVAEGLCTTQPGHDNHAHFDITAPEREDPATA